jgi:hypothetical protein
MFRHGELKARLLKMVHWKKNPELPNSHFGLPHLDSPAPAFVLDPYWIELSSSDMKMPEFE